MRVFFLLLTIQCVPDDYRPVSTQIEYASPFKLVRIARPKVKGMRRAKIGDVAVYTRQEKNGWDVHVFHSLKLFAEREGAWFELKGPTMLSDRSHPREEALRQPVVTGLKRSPSMIRVTWIEEWVGANRAGLTRHTVLLDFRAKPRVFLSIDCSDADGGGACTGPDAAHHTRRELTCDDDLRCTMRESVFVGWTTRSATRKFDLLTNETIAPSSRFDAVRYASGAAFAAAGREAVRQRALIDHIGAVHPVFEVSPGTVIFAAPEREPIVGFRFFLLDRGTWREIPRTVLTDSAYPGEPDGSAGSLSRTYTPDAPPLVFTAEDLYLPGKRKLIEVIGTEGEARSIYWILIDPNGRDGALRVATNQPEWRHCGNVVYPLSATYLGIPDRGLPAFVNAVAGWRAWILRDPSEVQPLLPTCNLHGTIDWSPKRGWIVRLGQEPCTDPIPRPFVTKIWQDGRMFAEAVEFSH